MGCLPRSSWATAISLGTGKTVSGSVTYGQYARGIDLAASEPYFLGTRVAAGIELYGRQNSTSPYQSYGSDIYGATLQFGTPITEQLGVQYRYSLYSQNVTLDPTSLAAAPSLPIREAALAGPQWVSAVGSTVNYNTLDNTKSPTSGFNSQLKQDLAGLGGDVRFLRTTEDLRYYHPINDDVVSLVRAQGGYHHRLGRPAGTATQQLLRRPDHGAGICAQRFWPARPHARQHHG